MSTHPRPLPVHKVITTGTPARQGLSCVPEKLPAAVALMMRGGIASMNWKNVTCAKCFENRKQGVRE